IFYFVGFASPEYARRGGNPETLDNTASNGIRVHPRTDARPETPPRPSREVFQSHGILFGRGWDSSAGVLPAKRVSLLGVKVSRVCSATLVPDVSLSFHVEAGPHLLSRCAKTASIACFFLCCFFSLQRQRQSYPHCR